MLPERSTWKVCELVTEIRKQVERNYVGVRVEGEISNLREAASGHMYFTLKDEQSQLPVVLFRSKAKLLKFRPKDGLEVQVHGGISVYEDRGQLQLVADNIEPRGKGSLQVAFEQLYARLKQEGLFEASQKRPLPPYPRVVGVITSPHGAVVHDIMNVLLRRHAKVQLLLYPVVVQGEAAEPEIVEAFNWFQQSAAVDVLIVARGGGSLEDLAAFNSEAVARAIAGSAVPVVSAVGHETDFTIADFVSDLRAPTPSAAAELVTDAQYRVEEYLETLCSRLERAARYQRMRARERFARLDASAVFARVQHGLARREQALDELRFRLEAAWDRACANTSRQLQLVRARLMQQDVLRQFARYQERLGAVEAALTQAIHVPMERRRTQWSRADGRLLALSPLSVLERGYALVYGAGGELVKDSAELTAGEELGLRFAKGRATAKVTQISSEFQASRNEGGSSRK
ncbi:MAG TPA: exodeoxyribonuclease VII large subunit [Acidobacteriaceae bacterium]|nr:exodeoxyribonuclease VII large subunit [Acidobacteriaceae bacterium]